VSSRNCSIFRYYEPLIAAFAKKYGSTIPNLETAHHTFTFGENLL
jgi:hypothetical protein